MPQRLQRSHIAYEFFIVLYVNVVAHNLVIMVCGNVLLYLLVPFLNRADYPKRRLVSDNSLLCNLIRP